jgi:iron complex transport system permease protein
VLGVSAVAALGAASAIVLGAAAFPGRSRSRRWSGAGVAGAPADPVLGAGPFARSSDPVRGRGVQFRRRATALIFNLSPSPIATAEVMSWLLGSVQNRSWVDVLWVTPPC